MLSNQFWYGFGIGVETMFCAGVTVAAVMYAYDKAAFAEKLAKFTKR